MYCFSLVKCNTIGCSPHGFFYHSGPQNLKLVINWQVDQSVRITELSYFFLLWLLWLFANVDVDKMYKTVNDGDLSMKVSLVRGRLNQNYLC